MPYNKGSRNPGVKIIWTEEMINFLINNYIKMNNHKLAEELGLGITAVRMKLYEMDYKRMELEYWTEEQVLFLKNNYKKKGDLELSEIFEKKWPKNKRWTIKHIEKKRKYLKLKRSQQEIENILHHNYEINRRLAPGARYRYIQRGNPKEGEIRFRMRDNLRVEPMVRISGRFVSWPSWIWGKTFGKPLAGFVIVFKDDDPTHTTIENFEVISRSALTKRNQIKAGANLSDSFVAHTLSYRDAISRKELLKHPKLLDAKRQLLILKRTIKNERKNNDSKTNSGKA